MVKGMTEESKKAEILKFQDSKNDTLKKMQDLTALLKASESVKEDPGEYEADDQFDDYMEQSLLKDADSLGIFEKSAQEASKNQYEEALARVKQEVAKVEPEHAE